MYLDRKVRLFLKTVLARHWPVLEWGCLWHAKVSLCLSPTHLYVGMLTEMGMLGKPRLVQAPSLIPRTVKSPSGGPIDFSVVTHMKNFSF